MLPGPKTTLGIPARANLLASLPYGTPIIQFRGYTIGQAHTNSHEDERQWTVSFRDNLTLSFNKAGRHDVRLGGEDGCFEAGRQLHFRRRFGRGGIVGQLHAARLAAPAGQDLGLDDHRSADLLCSGARLLGGRREAAVGYRDAEAREELLALVFVEIHRRGTLPVPRSASRRPSLGTRARGPTRVGVVTHHPLRSTIPPSDAPVGTEIVSIFRCVA